MLARIFFRILYTPSYLLRVTSNQQRCRFEIKRKMGSAVFLQNEVQNFSGRIMKTNWTTIKINFEHIHTPYCIKFL